MFATEERPRIALLSVPETLTSEVFNVAELLTRAFCVAVIPLLRFEETLISAEFEIPVPPVVLRFALREIISLFKVAEIEVRLYATELTFADTEFIALFALIAT